jgi:carbon-monoxide dehydrogenase medium subunit
LNINYLEPADFNEASQMLLQHGEDAKIIAGGTALVLMLRQKLIAPQVLISLGRIAGQDFIRLEADGLHLGALVSLRQVEQSPLVRQFCPALARAYSLVGNVRIRNQATVGGNLAEADYASDPPSMLLALGALVKVSGPGGAREIPIAEFFLGFYTTALEPAEIVTEVILPALPANQRSSYQKFSARSAEDRPCVVVAASAAFAPDGSCRDLRVVVGAAVETPQRLEQVESLARGTGLDDALIAAIADAYASQLEPLTDVRGSAWYRREMINVFVRRALQEVRNDHR